MPQSGLRAPIILNATPPRTAHSSSYGVAAHLLRRVRRLVALHVHDSGTLQCVCQTTDIVCERPFLCLNL